MACGRSACEGIGEEYINLSSESEIKRDVETKCCNVCDGSSASNFYDPFRIGGGIHGCTNRGHGGCLGASCWSKLGRQSLIRLEMRL